jgi:hypothetical protein
LGGCSMSAAGVMTRHEGAVKDEGNHTLQKDAMARRTTSFIRQYRFLMINTNLPPRDRCAYYRADPQLVQRGLWHQPVTNLRVRKIDRLGILTARDIWSQVSV